VLSGAPTRRAARAMARSRSTWCDREQAIVLLFTPAVRPTLARSGLHQGLSAGVRENGGSTRTRPSGRSWRSRRSATATGRRAVRDPEPDQPHEHAAGVYRYQVEPYVVAADVYAEAAACGRGGWTWYTGSAGWMYRAGIEWLLGFRLRGAALFIDPCIPRAGRGFSITFRYHSSRYEVRVENPHGVTRGVVARGDRRPGGRGRALSRCRWSTTAPRIRSRSSSADFVGKLLALRLRRSLQTERSAHVDTGQHRQASDPSDPRGLSIGLWVFSVIADLVVYLRGRRDGLEGRRVSTLLVAGSSAPSSPPCRDSSISSRSPTAPPSASRSFISSPTSPRSSCSP
jgi:hypothetical protein